MSRILVVVASGTVGSEIAKGLQSKGIEVVKATSQKSPAPGQVHLDLVSGEGLEHALRGVEKVFLLAPPGHVNQDQLLNPVIDQARSGGVKKIVLMTAMGANANPEAPFRKVEIHLEKSGLDYNIIRPNWFMQNFNSFWLHGILTQQKILLPTGTAKGSFIDARDIAAVAVELLINDRFSRQEFDLTGAEALDHDQVARILSEATGRVIRYQEISPAVMLEGLLGAGVPRPYSEFLLMILDFFKQGYSERVTDSVDRILGRRPISFTQYASDHKSAWKA